MLYSSGWDDLASNRWGQNLVADSVPAEHPIHHQNCRLRRQGPNKNALMVYCIYLGLVSIDYAALIG
jgi:hypothetical protein